MTKAAARRISQQIARIALEASKNHEAPAARAGLASAAAAAVDVTTPQARRSTSAVLSSPPASRQRALSTAFDLAADDAPTPSRFGSAEAAGRLQAATRLQATARRLAAEEELWVGRCTTTCYQISSFHR